MPIKPVTSALLLLYSLSLLSSIAGASILSSLIFLIALYGTFSHQLSWKVPLLPPVAIFVAALIINFLVTPRLIPWPDRLEELVWVFNLWGLSKALELAWSEKLERRLIYTLFGGIVVISIYGVLQFFTGVDFVRTAPSHMSPTGGVYRAAGFFSNALTYSNVIGAMGLLVTLPLFRARKALGALAVLLTAAGLLASQSRGSWIGYAVSALILLYAVRKSLSRKQIAMIFIIGLLPLAILINTEGFSNRLYRMLSLQMDESLSIRFDLWRAHWQMFLEHPIFGVGFQQARGLLMEYYAKLNINQDFVSHAHNDYIQALAETGIIGFIAFITLIIWTMKTTLSLKSRYREWAMSLFAAQVFIFMGSITQANFTDAEVSHCLMFNWALVNVLATRARAGLPRREPDIDKRE